MKVFILSCSIVLCCSLVVASPLKDSGINSLKEDNDVAALEIETDSEDVERAKKQANCPDLSGPIYVPVACSNEPNYVNVPVETLPESLNGLFVPYPPTSISHQEPMIQTPQYQITTHLQPSSMPGIQHGQQVPCQPLQPSNPQATMPQQAASPAAPPQQTTLTWTQLQPQQVQTLIMPSAAALSASVAPQIQPTTAFTWSQPQVPNVVVAQGPGLYDPAPAQSYQSQPISPLYTVVPSAPVYQTQPRPTYLLPQPPSPYQNQHAQLSPQVSFPVASGSTHVINAGQHSCIDGVRLSCHCKTDDGSNKVIRTSRDAATTTTMTAANQPATETTSDAKLRVERLAQVDSQYMTQQKLQQPVVYSHRSPRPFYAIHQQMSQPMSSLMTNYPQSLAFGNSPNSKRQTEQASQQQTGVTVDTKNVTKRSETIAPNLAQTVQLAPHSEAKDLAQKVAPIKKRTTDAVKVEDAKVADKTKA